MTLDNIPAEDRCLKDTAFATAVRRELEDVEYYAPTMPLSYSLYHAIIRRLLDELDKPQAGHGEGI